MPKVH